MHDDTVALADTDRKRVCEERLDGHEVCRDDLQHVVIDGEVEVEVGATVNDADEIRLVVLECLLEERAGLVLIASSRTVDNDSVSCWWACQRFVEGVIGVQMVPVADDDGRPFLRPVGSVGAVNDDRSSETVSVLCAIVGVVPAVAVLSEAELVSKSIAVGNRTLSHAYLTLVDDVYRTPNTLAVNAVHLIFVEHAETMEVDSRSIGLDSILHVDDKGVAPACFNELAGVLSIDDLSRTLEAIGADICLLNSKIILGVIRVVLEKTVGVDLQFSQYLLRVSQVTISQGGF